ncbi:hypothetical protein [Microvirgula aerodenitrificans]|nr:hypothetical protein [Microvirgula aerodenitrificans]
MAMIILLLTDELVGELCRTGWVIKAPVFVGRHRRPVFPAFRRVS